MIVDVPVPDEVCAVIVVVPCPTIWAVPAVVSINPITPGLLELQVAVTFEPFTEAVKVIVCPWLADRLKEVVAGEIVTAFEVFVQELPTHTETVPLAVPVDEVLVAEIVTDVELVAEIAMITPVLLTVTAAGSELVQVVPFAAVRFFLLPSSNTPVAVNCID